MSGSPPAVRARSTLRRGPQAPERGSSCELLLSLAQRSEVRDLLGGFGVRPDALTGACERFQRRPTQPEPVDWRLRLAQRAGQGTQADTGLEQLLAIVRSADSHAYQLLEEVGVPCARLRKQIIERMRALGEASVRHTTVARPRAPARPPEPRRRSSTMPPRRDRDRGPVRTELASTPSEVTEDEPRSQGSMDQGPVTARRPRPLDPRSLPPLQGREADLARLGDAVLRHGPRAPVLVGPHGSGRSLLARHLARLLDRPVFVLSAPAYADEDELRSDLEHVAQRRGVAVVDDLDRIAGEAAPPVLGALVHAWATHTPPVVTVLSHEGQARLQSWLPGLLETLDVLHLPPQTGPALARAVASAAPTVLEQHGVSLAPDADLRELTQLADRYLAGLAMPGRALDLLDLSCARTVRHGERVVRRQTWVDIVSERSGIGHARIECTDDRALLDLEQQLARRVVGHDHVLDALAALIRRNRAGFGSHRPVATALLLGPSGVGKTEIAKALAAALFERSNALVRLDMSEYAESHAVARIVGAPPGYVGFEQGGALTDPLLEHPHCVVLLDEIEKAHRDVHQLLLQVFDEGRLTDGRGRTVEFRHAVIIMTSNLGSERVQSDGDPDAEDAVLATARAAFPVELWNRIEAPLVMRALDPLQMQEICRRLAAQSSDRLFRERGIRYTLSDAACRLLVSWAGDDPALGARPLRHLLARRIEALIADAILAGRLCPGTQAVIEAAGDALVLR